MSSTELEPGGSVHSITALLLELSHGKPEAEARLVPQIYDELRRLAGHYMRQERANHTLQPTALVHEAYVRLVQQPRVQWQNRAHFFAAAAQLMRHILVDHARSRNAGKRGGLKNQVTLSDAVLQVNSKSIDMLALDQALEQLAAFDPRQARIVELHFFGGLTMLEVADVLDVGERTVKREWSMARAWLRNQLAVSS